MPAAPKCRCSKPWPNKTSSGDWVCVRCGYDLKLTPYQLALLAVKS